MNQEKLDRALELIGAFRINLESLATMVPLLKDHPLVKVIQKQAEDTEAKILEAIREA